MGIEYAQFYSHVWVQFKERSRNGHIWKFFPPNSHVSENVHALSSQWECSSPHKVRTKEKVRTDILASKNKFCLVRMKRPNNELGEKEKVNVNDINPTSQTQQ